MPAEARIGDVAVGVCCCHPPIPCVGWVGVIVTGAGTRSTEGASTARIGDVVVGCHPQVIVSGSGLQSVEGPSTARIGDATAGCTSGVIVTGAGSKSVG